MVLLLLFVAVVVQQTLTLQEFPDEGIVNLAQPFCCCNAGASLQTLQIMLAVLHFQTTAVSCLFLTWNVRTFDKMVLGIDFASSLLGLAFSIACAISSVQENRKIFTILHVLTWIGALGRPFMLAISVFFWQGANFTIPLLGILDWAAGAVEWILLIFVSVIYYWLYNLNK